MAKLSEFRVGQQVKCVRYGEGKYPEVVGLMGTVVEVWENAVPYPISVEFAGFDGIPAVMAPDELEIVGE